VTALQVTAVQILVGPVTLHRLQSLRMPRWSCRNNNSQTRVPPLRHQRLLSDYFLSHFIYNNYDRLYDRVVRIPGCRPTDRGFSSQRYQIIWAAVGLERGSLSLVRINEELLEKEVCFSGVETEINGRRYPSRLPSDTLLSAKVDTKIHWEASVAQSV
jgi:hypothetical protein